MLSHLMGEHRLAECCADAFEDILKADAPPDRDLFAERRRTLGRILVEHVQAERRNLYPLLAKSQSAEAICEGQQALAAINALYSDLMLHGNVWPYERVLMEWDAFRAEKRVLLARLRECIKTEDDRLYRRLLSPGEMRACAQGEACSQACRRDDKGASRAA